MNKIFLSGRLTADPEVRKTPGGVDVCNFTLAVDRPGTKKENKLTDFLHCTAWGGKEGPGKAGVISKYFQKGDGIIIVEVLTTRKYTNKAGVEVTGYDVQVDDFEFPMGKVGGPATTAAETTSSGSSGTTFPKGEGTGAEDETLPF